MLAINLISTTVKVAIDVDTKGFYQVFVSSIQITKLYFD